MILTVSSSFAQMNCMLHIYEYYIEYAARAPLHAETNFKWCKRYYDEVYRGLEADIPLMYLRSTITMQCGMPILAISWLVLFHVWEFMSSLIN